MTSKIELFKNNNVDDSKIITKGNVDIYGFKNPKLILESGRNFMVVKEAKKEKTFREFKNKRDWNIRDWKNENEKKDIGIVLTKEKLPDVTIDPTLDLKFTGKIPDDYKINMDIKDNITDLLKNNMLGGSNNYYDKYIKYKNKYIELKKSI